jgi:hypothetical protein
MHETKSARYYLIDIQAHPNKIDPARRELDIIPTLVFPDSELCCHLTWRTDPGSPDVWVFIFLTVEEDDLKILTQVPDLIYEISLMNSDTQPEKFEQILQRLGFRQKE